MKTNFASPQKASYRDAKPVRRPYRNSSYKDLPSAKSVNAEAEAFAKLVKEVAECGVDQAVPAVNRAFAAGCTAEQIRAAIAHYRTLTASGVTPGALYVKLKTMAPGEAANRRFPKGDPSVSAANAQAANRQYAIRQELDRLQQAEREADTAAREQAERHQLEAEHGRELDALTKAERLQLVEQTGSAGLLLEFRRKSTSDLVRFELLKMLRTRPAVPA